MQNANWCSRSGLNSWILISNLYSPISNSRSHTWNSQYLGLGRMGGNMAVRVMKGGHRVVVWNRSRGKVDEHIALGMDGTDKLADIPGMLKQSPPRGVVHAARGQDDRRDH